MFNDKKEKEIDSLRMESEYFLIISHLFHGLQSHFQIKKKKHLLFVFIDCYDIKSKNNCLHEIELQLFHTSSLHVLINFYGLIRLNVNTGH